MKNKIANNAGWIIICKVVQALLGLVVSMLSARYLGPSNYGIINYAASVVAFVVPVMQLGLRSTLVKEFVDHPQEEGKTLGTALVMNLISSFACIGGIVSFVMLANGGERVTVIVCALYSLNLIFQALEMSQYWFQVKLLSKYTSLTALCAYFVVSVYKLILLITQRSIYWFALSQVIDYLLISIAQLIIYKKLGGPKLSFSWGRAREMLSRSKHYIISGMMVTIFQQTDKLMLKNMVNDAATGHYSAAIACAGISSFVFAAIIDSYRPVILEAKKNSEAAYERHVSTLFSIVFYLSLLQCVLMTLLAKPMILILYGEEYSASIIALQIVVWYVTYSYFGSVRNIWVLAEEKQKYLWVINLVGALGNVVLNLCLIPIWGILGAAAASLATQFFTNFLLGFIMSPIRKCNVLMIKGMNPKLLADAVKRLRR